MGHKNKLSMIGQVNAALSACLAIGESKHQAKKEGTAAASIFSWGTFQTYTRQACRFVRWAKEAHGCKTLEAARPFVVEYLTAQKEKGLSPATIHTTASALGKVYGCPATSFGFSLPIRHRAEITRSRHPAERDKGFSSARNPLVVALGECVGTRRAEMAALTGDKLIDHGNGSYSIILDRGTKGGRRRVSPVVGPSDQVSLVVRAMQEAGAGKVVPSVPSHADIHAMRRTYAQRVYTANARPLDVCRRENAVYWCRKDRRGAWYDKAAMRIASEALGHSRISVIAAHYLD